MNHEGNPGIKISKTEISSLSDVIRFLNKVEGRQLYLGKNVTIRVIVVTEIFVYV